MRGVARFGMRPLPSGADFTGFGGLAARNSDWCQAICKKGGRRTHLPFCSPADIEKNMCQQCANTVSRVGADCGEVGAHDVVNVRKVC